MIGQAWGELLGGLSSTVKQHVEFHRINEIVNRVLDGSITSFIREDQYSKISLDAKLPLKDIDIPQYFSISISDKLFIRL